MTKTMLFSLRLSFKVYLKKRLINFIHIILSHFILSISKSRGFSISILPCTVLQKNFLGLQLSFHFVFIFSIIISLPTSILNANIKNKLMNIWQCVETVNFFGSSELQKKLKSVYNHINF